MTKKFRTVVGRGKPVWIGAGPYALGTVDQDSYEDLVVYADIQTGSTPYWVIVSGAPTGMTIDSATGRLSIGPNVTPAAYSIVVGLSNYGYPSVNRTFTMTVQLSNHPPVWSGSDPISLGTYTNDQARNIPLAGYASDVDSDPLTFAFVSSNPSGPSVSSAGVLTLPLNLAVGSYTVVVSVSDGIANPVSRTFSATVQAVGVPATGITAVSGYSISGSVAHGQEIIITKSGGGFGTKPLPTWIVDDGLGAWFGGNRINHPNPTEGMKVPTTVFAGTGGTNGTNTWPTMFTFSRPHRHSRITAHYYSSYEAASPPTIQCTKGTLYTPLRPPGVTKYGRAFYVSWYQRVKNPYQAAGGGSSGSKVLRLDGYTAANEYYMTGGGQFWPFRSGINVTMAAGDYASGGNALPQTTDWLKFECYIDMDRQYADSFVNGKHWPTSSSYVGGYFEFRPNGDYLTVTRTPSVDCRYVPLPILDRIYPDMIGFDSGSPDCAYQEIDISEPYFDWTMQLVEAVDGAYTYANYQARELFRITSWTDTEIRAVVNQGAFTSLAGKRLYVVTGPYSPASGVDSRLHVGTFT